MNNVKNLLIFFVEIIYLFFFLKNIFFFKKYKKNVKFLLYFKSKVFISVFQDSGAWDFFILYTYDYILRIYLIHTLIYFSEYALIEKASWRLFNYIYSPISNFLYFENFNFFFLLKFILLIFILFFVFYFYFIFIFI